MSEQPAFLNSDQVKILHRRALERHGGQEGIRDAAAFESAVMQPRNVWYYARGDVFDVAAA
jgi:prophage maintenance system killer protein